VLNRYFSSETVLNRYFSSQTVLNRYFSSETVLNRYFSSESMPKVRPGVVATLRHARITPGMKLDRS